LATAGVGETAAKVPEAAAVFRNLRLDCNMIARRVRRVRGRVSSATFQ